MLFVHVTKPKQWFWPFDMVKQQVFKNHLLSQVKGDLKGIIVTFENDYRLVWLAPMNLGDFGHIATFWIFTNIKTDLTLNIEGSSVINL